MKKRYIILALATLELASLPAGIEIASSLDLKSIVDPISKEMKQSLISIDISKKIPGQSTFLVSSNIPFAITVQDTLAEPQDLSPYYVEIYQSGNINGFEFGKKAALPGPSQACGLAQAGRAAILYEASGQTATLKPRLLDRSVAVTITYPKTQTPLFEFISHSETAQLPNATACEDLPT